jgi:hypothetical protein
MNARRHEILLTGHILFTQVHHTINLENLLFFSSDFGTILAEHIQAMEHYIPTVRALLQTRQTGLFPWDFLHPKEIDPFSFAWIEFV